MPNYHTQSKMKRLIRRPKSHGEWNLIFLYSIPAMAIFVAALVLFIRWVSLL